MKIIDRKAFLALPSGTLYCECDDSIDFGAPTVKYETVAGVDWVEGSLSTIEADDSGELFDRVVDMKRNGTSYPLDPDLWSGRNGSFDQDAKFVIYELADLKILAGVIADAIKVAEAAEPETVESSIAAADDAQHLRKLHADAKDALANCEALRPYAEPTIAAETVATDDVAPKYVSMIEAYRMLMKLSNHTHEYVVMKMASDLRISTAQVESMLIAGGPADDR